MGTNWPARDPWQVRVIRTVLFFVPSAHPDWDGKLHLIREWWIEFDENGLATREMGISEEGVPIVSAPDGRNYGFWTDSGTCIEDLELERTHSLAAADFLAAWAKSPSRTRQNP